MSCRTSCWKITKISKSVNSNNLKIKIKMIVHRKKKEEEGKVEQTLR